MRTLDFGAITDRYDDWYRQPLGQTYDRLETRAIRRALPPGCGRLLEVGCGTGHWSAVFADMGYAVTGVDISAEMIAAASAKGIPGADFLVADGEALPLRDDTFDVGACITVLEFAARPARIVAEMARCVRPGGKLIFGVLNRLSLLGLRRRWIRSAAYDAACFYSVRELKELLCAVGPCRVRTAAFLLPWRPVLRFAELTDRVARALRLPWGDFLVGQVQL